MARGKRKNYPRLATVDGIDVSTSNTRSIDRAMLLERRRARVHSKKVVCSKTVSLLSNHPNYSSPGFLRDAAPLLPLPDPPFGFVQRFSEERERLPEAENIVNARQLLGRHDETIAQDYLSRKSTHSRPVPLGRPSGTIRPMGRGVSPAKFKKQFFARLRVARIAAGLEMADCARELDVPIDTWRRYETRVLLPHHLLPTVCKMLKVDLSYFYKEEGSNEGRGTTGDQPIPARARHG